MVLTVLRRGNRRYGVVCPGEGMPSVRWRRCERGGCGGAPVGNLPSELPSVVAQERRRRSAAHGGPRPTGDLSAILCRPASAIYSDDLPNFTGEERSPQYMHGRGTRDQASGMMDELSVVLSTLICALIGLLV